MSKRPFRSLLILPFLLTSLAVVVPSAFAWQYTESAGSRAFEEAFAVAIDERTGHAVAAGTLFHDDSGFVLFAAQMNRQHGHEIWRFELPDDNGRARAVALAPDGDAVVAGEAGPRQLVVARLDAETGAPQWVARIPDGAAFGVAVDAVGDVIAAGTLGGEMGVVKLSGTDGSELWRANASGGERGQVRALAVDAAGDPVVTGWTALDAADRSSLGVFKLDGADGTRLWGHTIAPSRFSTNEGIAVAVDPFGDVVATGRTSVFANNAISFEFTVLKLAGEDGSLAWRRELSPGRPSDNPRALAVDAVGDVIALGTIADDAGFHSAVVKLSGDDGSDLWRRLFDRAFESDVTVDAVGDVVTAGGFSEPPRRLDLQVRKLGGATGELLWETLVDGPGHGGDIGRSVATDASGDVVVGGHLTGDATGPDFAVVKLDGATGEDFEWPDHRDRGGPGR